MKNEKERIISAAWKLKNRDDFVLGKCHTEIYEEYGDELSLETGAMGFCTSTYRFVGRVEAAQIAYEATQLDVDEAKYTDQNVVDKLNRALDDNIQVGEWKPLASETMFGKKHYYENDKSNV